VEIPCRAAYNRLAVTIEGDARGEHFPALTLKGSGTLDPLHNIRDIKLDAQSLQGSLHLTGESDWSPHVSWNAKIDAKNLHPHQWERLKTLEGEISARLASAGSVKNGKVQLTADINDLKGRWQKQALAGHGQMKMDGGQYHIKALEIKIGDNRVALDGKLDDKTLALDFDLDGKRLAAFHPALGGSLHPREAGRYEITHVPARLLRGKTVLMITHDPAEALRLADHLYILDHGLRELPANSDPAQLLEALGA